MVGIEHDNLEVAPRWLTGVTILGIVFEQIGFCGRRRRIGRCLSGDAFIDGPDVLKIVLMTGLDVVLMALSLTSEGYTTGEMVGAG